MALTFYAGKTPSTKKELLRLYIPLFSTLLWLLTGSAVLSAYLSRFLG